MNMTATEHLEDIQAETGVDSERLRVLTLDYIDERGLADQMAAYIRQRIRAQAWGGE